MDARILAHQAEIAALCQRFGVTRLEVFGSAARGVDFDPARSDVDLLVEFEAGFDPGSAGFLDLKEALEAVLARKVDLLDRGGIEQSRNWLRRQAILGQAETLYSP